MKCVTSPEAPHGRNRQAIPERRPVLPVIQELHDAWALRFEGGPNRRHIVGVGEGPLEEPAVAAQDFVGRVAGHPLEPFVRIDKRLVGQAGVGDGDALGGDVEGLVLQGEPLGELTRPAGRGDLSTPVAHQHLRSAR